MLNVLVVSQYISIHKGGAERYIHEVVTRLQKRGFNFTFLSAENKFRNGISRPIPFFSGGFNPFWKYQVNNILMKSRPDVVFAHFTVPGITDDAVRCAARLGIPVCLAYHSDVTGPEWYKQMIGGMYYRAMGMNTLKLAGKILVCSRKYVQASPWLAALKTSFGFASYGVDQIMAQGARTPGSPYLLFVGKPDVRSKGFAVLYNAWLCLKKHYSDLELIVAGEFAKKQNYPGARFLGQVSSRKGLADLYASAMLTILPSTSSAESFGMVLAESLIAGTPVVGSDIGGISELVVPGKNGYLAKPGDYHSLAGAIGKAILSNQELRSNVCSEKSVYLERFNWDKTTDIVEQALVEFAEGK